MRAALLFKQQEIDSTSEPLRITEIDCPKPRADEVLLKVLFCGVCHTDLDIIEGRICISRFPLIPGHQIIAKVQSCGANVTNLQIGQEVGVAWIASACGHCEFCQSGKENLCADFKASGKDCNGGFAEFVCAKAEFVFPLPAGMAKPESAPLLCAGAVGYRAIKIAGLESDTTLGLSGFGASGQLCLKLLRALKPNREIFVFARSPIERKLALKLGANWAGEIEASPPKALGAIIDTTPAWLVVKESLKNLLPAGRLIINAISKNKQDQSSLLELDYRKHIWLEKEIKSVANVTRQDVREFLTLASKLNLSSEIHPHPLNSTNEALRLLKLKPVDKPQVLLIE